MGTIFKLFNAIGSFIGSIIDTIDTFTDFIGNCITQCADLMSVIPSFVSAAFITALTFSIIIACKRALLG